MRIYSDEQIKTKRKRQKKIGKIAYWTFLVLIMFAVACVGISLCQKLISKSKSISLFGYSPFIISSGSMQPSLQVYDIVVVKKVKEDKLKSGDIIAFFDKEGNIITHRVVQISSKDGKNYYTTKGDFNTSNDTDLVTYDNIIGQYCFKIPNGGKFVFAITSPTAIVLFVLAALFIGFITIRNSNRKTARHRMREKYANSCVVHEKLESELESNVLIISEVRNEVVLPYSIEKLQDVLNNGETEYESMEDLIKKEYTVSLSKYKYAYISRFKEMVDLVCDREKGSVWSAVDLALEQFFNRYLHPAIITACDCLDCLDVYLDCLDKNELEKFPFFEIRYELKKEKKQKNDDKTKNVAITNKN